MLRKASSFPPKEDPQIFSALRPELTELPPTAARGEDRNLGRIDDRKGVRM